MGLDIVNLHTSGHADIETIQSLKAFPHILKTPKYKKGGPTPFFPWSTSPFPISTL
jgi:hypothetical protein